MSGIGQKVVLTVGFLLTALALTHIADACTGIRLTAQDGSIVYGRTLEFPVSLDASLIMVPRSFEYIGTTAPDAQNGKKWSTKYAFTGMGAYDLPHVIDGMNEKGLAVGLFYFPNFAHYPAPTEQNKDQVIGPWELGTYLLSQYATVDEVREGINSVTVAPVVLQQFGFVLPVHYVVHDATGKSIVIEYVNGETIIHDNPLGVVTNAPTFDWHMTNLSNYNNISITNVPPLQLSGTKIIGLSQGTGLQGLPGDFTSPSRFVRAVTFSQSAVPSANGPEGVLQVFHILNQFDIPKGAVRDTVNNQTTIEYTPWTTVSDLKNKQFHYRTYENQQVRRMDLLQMELDGKEVLRFPLDNGPEIIQKVG